MSLYSDYAVVASEIIALIVLLILYISLYFEKSKNVTTKILKECIFITQLALIMDTLNYVLEGNPDNTVILYITNFTTGILGDLILISFSKYVWSCVNEKKKTRKKVYLIISIIAIIDILFQIIGIIFGFTFRIENGFLKTAALYDISFIVMLLGLAICEGYLIHKRNIIGIKTCIIFSLYYVLPVISIIILIINPNISFISTSIAISFLIVYIGVEKTEKEKLILNMLNKDPLTQLLNRHAFNQIIKYYENNNKNVLVIYIDLNNLKTINDTKGHEEGDKYIKNFADKLKNNFKHNTIYRIGGDEFVIITDYDIETYQTLLSKTITLTKNGIEASYGISHNSGRFITDCINTADNIMQKNKTNYYLTNNIERRKIRRRKDD